MSSATLTGWQPFVANITQATDSNIFCVVSLADLITQGVATQQYSTGGLDSASTGVTAWSIVTPANGLQINVTTTGSSVATSSTSGTTSTTSAISTTLWYSTGDVALPMGSAGSTNGGISTTILSQVMVLFVSANPLYSYVISPTAWQTVFQTSSSSTLFQTSSNTTTFYYIPNRFTQQGANGVATVLGDIVGSTGTSSTSASNTKPVAAVYNQWLVNLTNCQQSTCLNLTSGVTISTPNAQALQQTSYALAYGAQYLQPYAFASNTANQGSNNIPALFAASQLNNDVDVSNSTVVWAFSRLTPYSNFMVSARSGGNDLGPSTGAALNLIWQFVDVILSTQASLCCANNGVVQQGVTLSAANTGYTTTGAMITGTTSGSTTSNSTVTAATPSTSTVSLNCGQLNGAQISGASAGIGIANTTPCGNLLNSIGVAAFLDPNWLAYLHASPGEFDTLFNDAYSAAQNGTAIPTTPVPVVAASSTSTGTTTTATTGSGTSSGTGASTTASTTTLSSSSPIFACQVLPSFDTTSIPATVVSALEQLQPLCVNPQCSTLGYKTSSQVTQGCAINIQNCLVSQTVANQGTITGSVQLTANVTCLQNLVGTTSTGTTTTTPLNSITGTSSTTGTGAAGTTSQTLGGTAANGTTTSSPSSTSSTTIPSSTTTPSTTATTTTPTTTTSSSSKTYVYLLIAFLVLIVIVFLIVVLGKRRSPPMYPYGMTGVQPGAVAMPQYAQANANPYMLPRY